MIRDLVEQAPKLAEPADVCIIGAGAAGIVLAVELASHGKRVLLLEGGGAGVEEDSQEPYQSEIKGLLHTGIHIGRFRAKGGSTTRWGGQILELDDLDFQQRNWICGSGWPIPKSELSSYYARALEMEGLAAATLEDDAVWREIGAKTPDFKYMESFFSRWCPEPNFGLLYHMALQESSRIEVWLHANAVALLCEGGMIRGLRTKTLSGIEAVFHAHHFVFCLGGIESSRFFLQPELAEKPWNRSGLLGRHFQDHIICNAATIEPLNPGAFHKIFDNVFSRGFKYQPKLRLSRERQISEQTLNVAAMIMFLSDSDQVGTELKTTVKKFVQGRWRDSSTEEIMRLLRYSPLLARQAYRYSIQHRAYVPPDARIELGVHCEQEPESKSSITLAEKRDSLGMLRTRIDWQVSEKEIDSIRTYVEVARDSLSSIARVIPDPDLMTAPDRFRAKCGDGYHHMGGMRMSASRSEGVVDLNLRLHGMENGYVCSSAVFPTSGFSNPTHTVIALAIRLAEHLSTR